MRILFVITVFAFLLLGCGRDATGVDDNSVTTAAAPASAAIVPGTKLRDNKEMVKADNTGARKIGRDEMAPADRYNHGSASPADVARYSGAKQPVEGGSERRQPTAAPEAPKKMDGKTNNAMVIISEIETPVLFTVSKTPCFGECKQYSLTLHADGMLVLNAKKNVKRKGYFTTVLPTLEANRIAALFQRVTANGLLTVYPSAEEIPADVPATKLEYPGANGIPQIVRVYSGAPADLQLLFDEAEKFAATADWKAALK